MLFLVFQLDDDRYAIEATRVICVLPQVDARVVPQAPAGVVGVIDWRGGPLQLVDLAQVLRDRPAHARYCGQLERGREGKGHIQDCLSRTRRCRCNQLLGPTRRGQSAARSRTSADRKTSSRLPG